METKNLIINNHSNTLVNMVNTLTITVNTLSDNLEENQGTMKTLNVILDSLRSQIVIIQQDIDNYSK